MDCLLIPAHASQESVELIGARDQYTADLSDGQRLALEGVIYLSSGTIEVGRDVLCAPKGDRAVVGCDLHNSSLLQSFG